MSIPQALINSIREGEVVLFLGAGASVGANHPSNKSIPTGRELSEILIKRFLGDEYIGISLTKACELSADQTSLFNVQDFIFSIYKEYRPADFHLILPTFFWKAIYTTNFDTIIEQTYQIAMQKSKQEKEACLQILAPIYRNSDNLEEKLKTDGSIAFSKLHGCITITRDDKLPLILTTEQYISHRKNRDRLFDRFNEHAEHYPVVYIGYNIDDSDIRSVLLNIKLSNNIMPRSYIVLPNLKQAEKLFWDRNYGLTALDMTFEQFLKEIDSSINKPMRQLTKLIETFEHPIMRRFKVSGAKISERVRLLITKYAEYVHQNIVPSILTPQQFYRGYSNDFSPIINNYDFKRSISDNIITEIFLKEESERDTVQELYVLEGHAGSGKTILLRRFAWDASILLNKLCLWVTSINPPEYDAIYELFKLCDDRIFIFLDPASKYTETIKEWLQKSKRDRLPITFIVGERNHEWNVSCVDLHPFITEIYELKYLRNKEIDELLLKLKQNKSLGYLESLPIEKQKEQFVQQSGRQLLVALYESTLGKPFEDIILDEYNSISSIRAKSLYLTTCILHRLGLPARAGLISRVHGISFSEFKEKLFLPLERIVEAQEEKFLKDYVYVSRHSIVAEMVFDRVLVDETDRYNEYLRLINSIDQGYSSDKQAFLRLTNARQLLQLFKNSENIRNLYKAADERIGEDPFLLQQEAIFEMNSSDGSLEKASNLLIQANLKFPGNKLIKHSMSELYLKKSESSETSLERNKYRHEANKISRELTREDLPSPYPHHTLIKSSIEELLEIIEYGDQVAIERKINNVEKIIEQAKQSFPDNSMILSEESKFLEYMQDHPRALKTLEQAFKNNKGDAYIAIRLSKLYLQDNRPEDAIRILSDCVETRPSNKYSNYNLALLLLEYHPERKADIKICFRRSFTDGDTNYFAQFWYARHLYLEDPFGDNKIYFNALKKVYIDVDIKNKPRGFVSENGNNIIFSGIINKLEHSFGFIARDGYKDIIFMHRSNSNEKDWETFSIGNRVIFELAFNFSGPSAINVTQEK